MMTNIYSLAKDPFIKAHRALFSCTCSLNLDEVLVRQVLGRLKLSCPFYLRHGLQMTCISYKVTMSFSLYLPSVMLMYCMHTAQCTVVYIILEMFNSTWSLHTSTSFNQYKHERC